MRKAVVILRDNGSAKIPAFHQGLTAAGYQVIPGGIYPGLTALDKIGDGDLLLCWNRHIGTNEYCMRAEKRGARILVAENGYIGNDPRGKQYYALALGHHNGAGDWRVGDPQRWADLKVALADWRQDGRHILMLPQRGIGEPGIRMPPKWAERTAQLIRSVTSRPVIVRRHPGRLHIPLEPDLRNAWCAVTWASGAGIKALAAGIPVFYDFPQWIGGAAAIKLRNKKGALANFEQPFLGDRLPMFQRLAWAQFSLEEIASGYAITWLTSSSTKAITRDPA
jgi:hypothetical protein